MRAGLWVAFGGASLALIALLIFGGPGGPLAGRSPMNVEAVAAMASLLLILMHPNRDPALAAIGSTAWSWFDLAVMGMVGAATALFFVPNLSAPLAFDDYRHIYDVSKEPWQGVIRWFTSPSPAAFYRPVGYVSYWLDCLWAARDPLRWHIASLAAHVANCSLVYLLARQLRLTRAPAAIAAMLFAIHASRAEAVAWTDARFDVLSACFVLMSLAFLIHSFDTNRRLSFVLALAAAWLAILTKESAFCLPLLVLCLIPFRHRTERPRVIRASLAFVAVCIAGFIYRWWFIGGIGGYRTVDGRNGFLSFSAVRAVKVLFLRLWAVLAFPINWSVEPGMPLKIGIVILLLTIAVASWYATTSRWQVAATVAMVLASALPVQHLLAIGQDLKGARLLYLPVLGIAIGWGVIAQGLMVTTQKLLLGLGLLCFHGVALEHNLKMWREVPVLARNACIEMGRELARDPRPVAVRDLPESLRGVYFLANGFPECVLFQSGQDARRVWIEGQSTEPRDPSARNFAWNGTSFEEKGVRRIY